MSTPEPPSADVPEHSKVEPTPIYITPRMRLILIIAAFVVVYLLAAAAPNIPRLLVLGATLALILSFPVRVLSRWIARRWAIAISVGSTLFLALFLLLLLIPFIVAEVSQFIQAIPEIAENAQDLTRDVIVEMNDRGWIRQDPDQVLNNVQANLIDRAQTLIETALGGVLDGLARSISILISTFGVIFIATYLLIDMPRVRSSFVRSFAERYQPDAEQLWTTLADSLSRYLGGLLLSITLQGVLAGLGLWLIGVPYAFILSIWMAVTAILPYIGAFLGAIPAVILAFTMSWQTGVLTILLYVVINQLEGNLLTPRIQGNAVRVHPLLIFIAVLLGAELGGTLGAVIAVPTLAVSRVLGEFFWVRLRVQGPPRDTFLAAIRGEPGPSLTEGEMQYPPHPDPDVRTKSDRASTAHNHSGETDESRGMASRESNGR